MSKYVGTCTWNDVPHLSEKAKEELWNSIPVFQRDARSKGIPQLGSGAVYPVPEADIVCDPIELPAWYRHVYALDVGWNRTAALWGALDPETDVLYIYAEYYRGQAEPAVHAAAIKARGDWVPGVIDPASRGRSQHDGEALFDAYKGLGLTLAPANNAVEAGIYEVWTRLSTGRLKVFKICQNLLAEYRIYRRDEKGKIVKENDHLLDGLRYMCMSGIQIATIRPYQQWPGRPGMEGLRRVGGLQADYQPLASAWNPSPQQVNGGQQARNDGWWPGKQR